MCISAPDVGSVMRRSCELAGLGVAIGWAGARCARMVGTAWLVSTRPPFWRAWGCCGDVRFGVPRRTRAVPSCAAGTAFARLGAGVLGASSAHPVGLTGLRRRAVRAARRGEVRRMVSVLVGSAGHLRGRVDYAIARPLDFV